MALELQHASFAYPNGFLAVEDVSLRIKAGERVAIVGQNGAGKTTCVKLMNGIYKPSEGDMLVDGVNTKERTTAQIAGLVGYVFQNPDDQIFNQTVLSEVAYMLRRIKLPQEEIDRRVEYALTLTGLTELKEENPYDIPFPIRKFLTIASVLATEPKYLILDEPTAGQDTRGNRILGEIIDEVSAKGVAVITISHVMEFVADNFERVVAMAHRNVILDAPMREVFWNDEVIAESRIRRPEFAGIAELLGWRDNIVFCEELVEETVRKLRG